MQTLHFLYHEIRPAKSGYSYAIDLQEFEAHAAFLAGSLRAAENTPGDAAVCPAITFDDGHLSDYEYALPVLERHQLTAHFFITAGWTGQRAGYMGWPEVCALQKAGQQVGAHGWSHTLLTHCDRHALQKELRDSRLKLEDGLGVAVTSMSLPGGRYNRHVLAGCWEAGYERVFTSEPRAERMPPTGKLIGRLNLLGTSGVDLLQQLLTPESQKLAALGRQYRVKRAVQSLLGDSLYAKVWTLANGRKTSGEESPDRDAEVNL